MRNPWWFISLSLLVITGVVVVSLLQNNRANLQNLERSLADISEALKQNQGISSEAFRAFEQLTDALRLDSDVVTPEAIGVIRFQVANVGNEIGALLLAAEDALDDVQQSVAKVQQDAAPEAQPLAIVAAVGLISTLSSLVLAWWRQEGRASRRFNMEAAAAEDEREHVDN